MSETTEGRHQTAPLPRLKNIIQAPLNGSVGQEFLGTQKTAYESFVPVTRTASLLNDTISPRSFSSTWKQMSFHFPWIMQSWCINRRSSNIALLH